METPGRPRVHGFFLSFFLEGEEGAGVGSPVFWLGDGAEGEVEEVGGQLHGFFFFGDGFKGADEDGARLGWPAFWFCCGRDAAGVSAFESGFVVLSSVFAGIC